MKLTGSIKILTVMLCCVSLTCVAASAQSAPDALVEEALANNPELEAVRLRAEQFSWKVDQKGSLDDPVLSLSFSNYPNDSLNRDETAMTGDEVRLAQKFPYPGKRDGRAAVAQADSEWSNFQYLDSRHQLAGRVEDVWLRLFYTDRALEVVGRNLALLDDMARLTETRYATGKGMQQDILSTQLEQSRLMQQSLTLQQQRQTTQAQLNLLLSRDLESHHETPTQLNWQDAQVHTLEQYQLLAEQQRPIHQAYLSLQERYRKQQQLAKLDDYPDFTLWAGWRFRDSGLPDGGDAAPQWPKRHPGCAWWSNRRSRRKTASPAIFTTPTSGCNRPSSNSPSIAKALSRKRKPPTAPP